MLQKKVKTAKYRFSLMQPHTKRPLERRMTMFNPIDPNNSGMSFKFLVKDKSKAAI
jgi:hypothetical protein